MAGVIKEAAAGAAERFSFKDFEREGHAVLARAKAQATELLQAARQRGVAQAKAAREAAYAEGLAAGRKAGEAQIRKEIREEVQKTTANDVQAAIGILGAALANVEQNKHRLLAQAEQGLLNVAIAIAQRVCKHLPEFDRNAVVENCRQTLQAVGRHGDLELRVHPDDLSMVETWAAEFVAQTERLDTVNVISDPTVDRGGCLVCGRDVRIDATIAAQLDRIARAVVGDSEVLSDGAS